MVICGGFTNATEVVAEEEFPAASDACTWMELVPGTSDCEQLNVAPDNVAIEPPQLTVVTPESASVPVPCTVMVDVLNTAPAVGEVIGTTGGVLSSLIIAVAEAEFPATSATDCVIDCPPPSVLTSSVPGHNTTPERPSKHVKVNVTSVLFQPAALGAVLDAAEMNGAVPSMFIVTLALAVLPALSTAWPVITCAAPSVPTVTGAGQMATPEVASLQAKATVTAELFHLAAFAAGLATAVITGGAFLKPKKTLAIPPPRAPRPRTSICFENTPTTRLF